MRNAVILTTLAVAALLIGCSTPPPKPMPTASQLAASLESSGLPVTSVVVYTEDTDPNHLLGRPNQYVGKLSWQDSRVPEGSRPATIEVFAKVEYLRDRHKYLTDIAQASPLLGGTYVFPDEPHLALLRVPYGLTPEQADAYRAWLAAI
jgi:hypothetical protein